MVTAIKALPRPGVESLGPQSGVCRHAPHLRPERLVDAADNLWILDPAAPMLMSIIPKLAKVDLRTNRVAQVIPIGPDVAKTSSYINDVRTDNRRNFADITGSGLGGIIVVDLLGPTGRTPAFHSDAIALSSLRRVSRPDERVARSQRQTGCRKVRHHFSRRWHLNGFQAVHLFEQPTAEFGIAPWLPTEKSRRW
jgi:hypothetical protein